MALTASGPSGEIRVGGRQAAKLGKWTYQTDGKGGWTCSAALAAVTDAYLMDSSGVRELRLHAGSQTWRYRGVTISATGASMTASGQGKYEVL